MMGEGAFSGSPCFGIGEKESIQGIGILPLKRCQRVFDQRRDG